MNTFARHAWIRRLGLGSALLLILGLAQAQFKVVNPDGSVTYTDRPPASTGSKVTPLGRQSAGAGSTPTAPAPGEAALPQELRVAMQRHPVTLYTGDACSTCDTARRMLVQRGIPFAERRINTEEDVAALERLLGARSVPSLTIGNQPLRGYNETDWASYLDVAGYPKQSRLPRNWAGQAPRPLVERAAPAAAAPAETPSPAVAAPPPDPATQASPPNRIRF